MPIIIEPGLPLGYLDRTDTVIDYLSESQGRYVISLKTLVMRPQLVIASLENGSVIAVEKTDESVATQWHIVKHYIYQSWFAKKALRWITGGDADESIQNLNNEHFLRATLGSQMHSDFGQRKDQKDRPFKFLFTNRKIRPHRRYLITKLRSESLLDVALWSCLENYDTWGHPEFNTVYTQDVIIDTRSLPRGYDPEVAPDWIDGVVYPKQFDDTYFSLVSETVFEYPHSFRTEKIYKPILAGHPFLVCANRGFYRDLQGLGFQTFGHWIDESFDLIDDGQTRMDRLIAQVKWLCDQDLDRFWSETRAVCLYNQQHAQALHSKQQNTFSDKFREFMNA